MALPCLHLFAKCAIVLTMLTTKQKATLIKKSAKHDKDTGSSEVQVAILSKRIDELTSHLKKHKKDVGSRRGLLKMVADRRTHMKYLDIKNKTASK